MACEGTTGTVQVSYGHVVGAWDGYDEWLRRLVRDVRPTRLLEVGAGATPSIALSELDLLGVREYSILDISRDELDKASVGYKKICADISAKYLALGGGYDLIFSRMLAEHVRVPETFHRNIYNLLSPGGRAFHFFATMFSPVYMLNRVLPEVLTEKLVFFAEQANPNRTNKFPAYYRWCYGPVSWQIRRFEHLGFQVELYKGFFGHGYYNKIPVLKEVHQWLTARLLRKPNPYLTTVAYLVLRRPLT